MWGWKWEGGLVGEVGWLVGWWYYEGLSLIKLRMSIPRPSIQIRAVAPPSGLYTHRKILLPYFQTNPDHQRRTIILYYGHLFTVHIYFPFTIRENSNLILVSRSSILFLQINPSHSFPHSDLIAFPYSIFPPFPPSSWIGVRHRTSLRDHMAS